MVKYGLTGAYAQYLVAMNRHPDGITIGELSEVCDKDKAAVSRIISNMEKKGLVTRKAHNNTMYRAPLHLTEQGQKAADFITERAKIAVQKAGEGLSELERQKFYYALGLISSNLETIYEEGLPES
jgi:DNA-binding MarR family transcriptional regulator